MRRFRGEEVIIRVEKSGRGVVSVVVVSVVGGSVEERADILIVQLLRLEVLNHCQ